jgi:aspartate/methionine/tyrosine aminotransferase
MEDNRMKIKASLRSGSVQEYYFSKKLKEVDELRSKGADIINLGIGSPDMPPSVDVLDELDRNARVAGNHGYQSYYGIPQLRRAFSDWYSAFFGVTLDPSTEILPLIGSKEGIMHISMAFLDPGDTVLVPDPGYPTYTSASKLAGANVKYYNLSEDNSWLPDFEAIEKEDLTDVKLMWVNYPHMPTGAPATKELLSELVNFGRRHGILICNDNPYSFILNDNPLSIFSIEGAKDVALELNSLSKSHNMPGWRIGMVAGNSGFISTVIKVKSNMDSGMFKPLQMAAVLALGKGRDWYESVNSIYRSRRNKAEKIMDLLNCKYDINQQGLFLWGRVPENYASGEELADKLLYEASIFITPGIVFGSRGERYIRISLCADDLKLDESIKRITGLK